jgi:hypothetical protein
LAPAPLMLAECPATWKRRFHKRYIYEVIDEPRTFVGATQFWAMIQKQRAQQLLN